MASKASIAQSCVQGITTAYSKYFELTGGLALGWAPESFIQTEIAAALFEDRAVPYVSLESCVYETLDFARKKSSGRPPSIRKGRFDIVGWTKAGAPSVIVEVKKAWRTIAINADAERLRKFLKQKGTTRLGLISVYSSAASDDLLRKRMGDLARISKTRLAALQISEELNDPDGKKWFWCAACFEVPVK